MIAKVSSGLSFAGSKVPPWEARRLLAISAVELLICLSVPIRAFLFSSVKESSYDSSATLELETLISLIKGLEVDPPSNSPPKHSLTVASGPILTIWSEQGKARPWWTR